MPWSEAELKEMADAAYKHYGVNCPVCRASVRVDKILMTGGGQQLKFWCERCNEKAYYYEEHIVAMGLEWTVEQKNRIEDDFWMRGAASCPSDGSNLNVYKGYTAGTGELVVSATCPRCGRKSKRTKAQSDAERGTRMNRFTEAYEFIRIIASGGMGQVSLVRERNTGTQFAAKTIKPEYLRDAEAIRRFQREKRVLASLDHPNIVKLHETFMDEDGGVFIMEFMPRGDLGAVINSATITASELASLFDGIAAGIAHTHMQGIVHRDLKPGNVLVDAQGNARISDFGLAVLTNRDTTPLTLFGGMGTRHYAAPEQMTDAANVDYRADIFALGLIAYEIATRESPWTPPVVSTGHEALDAVLKRCFHRERDRRTASVQELAQALRARLVTEIPSP